MCSCQKVITTCVHYGPKIISALVKFIVDANFTQPPPTLQISIKNSPDCQEGDESYSSASSSDDEDDANDEGGPGGEEKDDANKKDKEEVKKADEVKGPDSTEATPPAAVEDHRTEDKAQVEEAAKDEGIGGNTAEPATAEAHAAAMTAEKLPKATPSQGSDSGRTLFANICDMYHAYIPMSGVV